MMNDVLMRHTKGVSSYKEFLPLLLADFEYSSYLWNVLQSLLITSRCFLQKGHNEAARTQLGRRLLIWGNSAMFDTCEKHVLSVIIFK